MKAVNGDRQTLTLKRANLLVSTSKQRLTHLHDTGISDDILVSFNALVVCLSGGTIAVDQEAHHSTRWVQIQLWKDSS